MPIVFELKCSDCNYMAMASSSGVLVNDDGNHVILGHPGETGRVRDLSGKTMEELLQLDRIRYVYQLVCGACGELGLYSREDLGLSTETGELGVYFRLLTYHPSDADAAHAACKSCGKHLVRGMAEMEGLVCPRCGHTTQSMVQAGIS
jgi:hypothetical protein